jgi:hypothetical protein
MSSTICYISEKGTETSALDAHAELLRSHYPRELAQEDNFSQTLT